ncbi:uncharacterized protein RCC_10566 [Ramularia collo-cygni]|uniref:Uncharacterized protein n=1 Tax=Ramularia collo-cygni TaxID=112498 RepID=A0A2D3VR96_9PEZI|nr:uncharacterized protein RCC_10566 [Ramularia collo-cygni]CZT24838.1 uncharacterized protein RCC_10566 [Ramularia collo-cygni]
MKSFISLAVFLTVSLAQHVTVPTTCTGKFSAGSDEVLFTVPYTYTEVLSIIGNYSNLTWSGSPENSVSLNGSDNKVGTARTYDLAGAHLIETILQYSKPPAPGPYVEVHNTATISVTGVDVYIPFDGTVVTSMCDGQASMFNLTTHFCATNVTMAAGLLHQLHLGDVQTVGKFLGGKDFTGCSNGSDSAPSETTSSSAPKSTSSGTTSSSAMEPTSSGTMTTAATDSAPSETASSSSSFTGEAMRQSVGILGSAVIVALVSGGLC